MSRDDRPVFLSTLPAGRQEQKLGLAVIVLSFAGFLVAMPFAQRPLPRVEAFVPLHASALVIVDLITAILLYGQFAILRSRALLVLASGYFFAACLAVAHTLSFPGLFAPEGLLGGGRQTTRWLYLFWHGGFPLAIIAYALLKDPEAVPKAAAGSSRPAILASLAAVSALAALLVALATSGHGGLPAIMVEDRYGASMAFVVTPVWGLSLVALVILWSRQPHSGLDFWLMVVMCAWIFDVALSAVFNAARFDLGFYAGRLYGLFAASFVLAVLLIENGVLYGRLVAAFDRERSGRERVETEAQDMRERLAGIVDSAMDAIITVDDSHRIVVFNAAAEALFGCPRAEAIGSPISRFLPERFRREHDAHIARFGDTRVVSRRMGAQRIVMGLRHGGEEFPADASISQIEQDGRKFYTVILRDVTERVLADERLRASREELREFAALAQAAREQEQRRIARELHDELGQSLAALKMDVDWMQRGLPPGQEAQVERLAEMKRLLDGTVEATRRIASDLRPLILDDLGLVPAVEWLVQGLRKRSGLDARLTVFPADLDLRDPHATALFRIVQESMTNIVRHAGATRVDIAIERTDGEIRVTVRDDGKGFETADPRKPLSTGLVGLRERAYFLDGEVDVESAPGQGTTVRVRIPFAGAAGAH